MSGGSVALGHPSRITEGQLQDLFLIYANERRVKVVAGSTDNLYSERITTRGHIDTIAVEGFVSMITSMPGVVTRQGLPRIENVKWAFMSKLPPCSIIPNNQSSLKKTKRIFELTWPLFLGSLAEVSVLKYRHLDIERSHAFERFLEDHVGPLFELRFREVAGAEGEALAAADGDVGGGSTIFGDEAVRSRGQRCGTAAVRARASRCVLSGEGIITLAEAKQRGLRYTTFNVHDFEPIAGAGADTRLAISMALPVSNVGTAGGGAQLFGVHGKGDGLFRRSSPRDASQGRPYSGIFSGEGAALRSSASAGGWGYETGYETGVFAGADAVGRGSKASAGVFRGDRYALSVLRGDDTAAQDAETWTTAAQAPAPLLNSNSYGGDEEYGGRRGGGGDTTRAFRDNR